MPPGEHATVLSRRTEPRSGVTLWTAIAIAAAVLGLLLAALLASLLLGFWQSRIPVIPAPPAAILAAPAPTTTVYSLEAEPRALVVVFASLHEQAQTLNRLALFVERAGAPHDHVLTDGQMAEALRVSGNAPDTLYYGHDYRAADMRRFFAQADRDTVALTENEEWLRRLLRQQKMDGADAAGALISFPRAGSEGGSEGGMDSQGRGAVFQHELSHAAYFTSPAYARFAARYWADMLTADERDRITAFLRRDGYDTGIADLVVNEAQAYLFFTPDARFFNAHAIGMTTARLAELRQAYESQEPAGWWQREEP